MGRGAWQAGSWDHKESGMTKHTAHTHKLIDTQLVSLFIFKKIL